jgi:tRNA 2-thiouridine synthesizing protein A
MESVFIMGTRHLDTTGLISPEPMLKLAVAAPDMKSGDILEITGDSPTFEKDIRSWCDRLGKEITGVDSKGEYARCITIRF